MIQLLVPGEVSASQACLPTLGLTRKLCLWHSCTIFESKIPELETGSLTESEWVEQHLGRPVVKVFNNIYAAHLEKSGQPAGTPGRISLPVAGDNAAAKQQVMALVDELGFDAVDDGSLHESWRQQPGTPCYGTDLPAAELQQQLASLGTMRTPEQHAQFAANHAEQERGMMQQPQS